MRLFCGCERRGAACGGLPEGGGFWTLLFLACKQDFRVRDHEGRVEHHDTDGILDGDRVDQEDARVERDGVGRDEGACECGAHAAWS